MLYIEFEIKNPAKFEIFKEVYELLFVTKPKEERSPMSTWKRLIPPYAQEFIGTYYKDDMTEKPEHRYGFRDMVTYLQFGMEVEFDYLTITENTAKLGMSAYAFPYGGMDRFLVFLKAYECIPIESYNGFTVIRFIWEGDFDYDVTEHPDLSEAYVKSMRASGK